MTNLKQASSQLFRRQPDERFASVADLWQHCHALRERSQDRWELPLEIVPTAASSELKLAVGSDGAFALNDWAFGQYCSMARVHKGTLNRLAPTTAAQVLLETRPGGNKPLQVLTIGDQLRSLHGVAYSRLWSEDVVSLLREYDTFQPPPVGFNGATGLYAGEQDMFAFMVDPNGWVEIGDEQFAPGLFLWNSEVGKRSVGLSTFFYQRICGNHIVWGATEVEEFTRKHTGRIEESLTEIRRRIDALIARRDERRDTFASAVRSAMDAKLGQDADEATKALTKHGIPLAIVKKAIDGSAMTRPYTVWKMVDAITRLARELPNAGDRVDADERASNLLSLAV